MENKILFTASTYSHILNFHLPYLRWFKEQGWIVHVACSGEPASIPNANQVFQIALEKSMFSPRNIKALMQLRHLIKTEKYTIVSSHASLAGFFTRFAVKGMKKRPLMVNTVHGYLFDDNTKAIKRNILLLAERLVVPQTDLLFTMNQWDYELAKSKRLGKQVTYISGIGKDFSSLKQVGPEDRLALRKELGISEDAIVLIYPAEFSKRKSQWVLVHAMKKLPENCVLILPGSGDLFEECCNLAKQLGLTNRIIFPGYIKKLESWYATSDIAVASSRSEGLPFNVIEAMYFGLPVVASKVKGHTDMIQDGVNGLLYPYGDSDSCAIAVRALIESSSLRQTLRSNAKETVKQYSLSNVMPEVIRQYQDLLSAENSSAYLEEKT